ncbi:SsrA-binding protein SmpB [Candidatus Uhrbacteria bacterium]|nr:SsrA-binding protein SmpB [Candidatus Uhrbacteria bacterium]
MKQVAYNKRAGFDFELLDKQEAGLVLTGPEVKAVKAGLVQFKGAFLDIRKGELWLKNAHITPYGPAASAQQGYEPTRDRKVLVHKRELKRLIGKKQAEGLTLVPVSLYIKNNLVKLEFAVARGKKKYEKREAIKKRDVQKQIRERLRE